MCTAGSFRAQRKGEQAVRTAIISLTFIGLLIQATPAAARVHGGAGSHVLYATSFSTKVLHQWPGSSAPGWKANAKGAAIYDGRDNTAVFAPFSLGTRTDYAVTMTVHGSFGTLPNSIPTAGFGLVIRAGSSVDSWIFAGKFVGIQGGPYLLKWGTDSAGGGIPDRVTVPGLSKSGSDIFRVEVHGADISFSVDGTPVVELPIHHADKDTRIGIWSQFAKVSIRSFSIEQLPAASVSQSIPNVKADNLKQSDVPAGFALTSGHFQTNAEYQRLTGATAHDMDVMGRVLDYGVSFGAGAGIPYFGLYSELADFTSTHNAVEGYLEYVHGVRGNFSAGPYLADEDVAGTGDAAHFIALDPPPQNGTPYRLAVLFFARGNYAGRLIVTSDPSVYSANNLKTQLLQLAAIEIQRIDRNG